MLRPELLKRLRALHSTFGGVSVANPDEEMVCSYRVTSSGRKELVVREGGEYYRTNCPFCQDTRRRLWFNYRWGLFDPITQSRNLFLCVCYNENCLSKDPGRIKTLYDMIFSDFSHESDHIRNTKDATAAPVVGELPGDLLLVKDLVLNHPAAQYLITAGYDLKTLSDLYNVSFCLNAKPEQRAAQGRIIIPIYNNGELRGWQARYVGKPPKGIPKYYSMKNMKRNQLIYNLDNARKHEDFVVLFEGPKDVWTFGPEAVAIFGKTISTYQASKITGIWKKVYIALDGDTYDPVTGISYDTQGIYDALGNGVERIPVRLPGRYSPADIPAPKLRSLILDSTPVAV